MKQGDVFTVNEIEPLFIAETVTPSGAVYARKFDIHNGAFGGTEAFQSSNEFNILFNSLGQSGSFAKVKIGDITLESFVLLRGDSFMKQGAVFIVNGIEPLFIAETVTPNGEVLAQKFDIHEGAYGGTDVFQSDAEFSILFNSLSRSGSLAQVKIGDVTLEKFVFLRKDSSLVSANSTSLLERRMRPGAYSDGGFLGGTESLELVLAQDEQTLIKLGVTFEKIADELEKIVKAALEQHHKWKSPESRKRAHYFPNLRQNEGTPIFTLENLPSLDVGYLTDKYQMFFSGTKGLQECPWDGHFSNWSSFIFLLLNRQTGEYVVAPGLIVHLIREHHFFEGNESPYRVEPFKLAQVLGLM